jgi:GH24 family phage-related lysozyme (muramidase)
MPRVKRMDERGRRWLAALEGGVRLEAYCDIHDRRPCPPGCDGTWTIGVGQTMLYGRPVKRGDRLPDHERGLALYADTLERYEKAVADALTRDIDQARFNAFVALAYNIGTGRFRSSTALARFNSGESPERVVEALKWYKFSAGKPKLVSRRQAEADLFIYRTYHTQGQPRPQNALKA